MKGIKAIAIVAVLGVIVITTCTVVLLTTQMVTARPDKARGYTGGVYYDFTEPNILTHHHGRGEKTVYRKVEANKEDVITWDANAPTYEFVDAEVIWDANDIEADTENLWDEELLVDITRGDPTTYVDLCIVLKNGREVVFNFRGDKLEIEGMEHCDEVAKLFFEHYLKPLADAYIAERINGR